MSAAFKRGRVGAPSRITKEIQDKICEALRIGCYIEGAAAYAGIHKRTVYNWMERGHKQKSGPYREFLHAVEIAIDEGEAVHLNNIYEKSKVDWRASAWTLERKFPKRYGRREIIKEESPDTKPQDSAFEGDSVNAFVARQLDAIEDDRWED